MINYEEETEEEPTCPGCGLTQDEWTAGGGKGFVAKSGEIYCCDACAQGKECRCVESSEDVARRALA